MGRIVVDTRITNLFDEDKSIRCEMLGRYRRGRAHPAFGLEGSAWGVQAV